MAVEGEWWTESIDSGKVPEDGARFDVIIVGGGPAGGSTAIDLARRGGKVLLLDAGVFPRDKICGDAVGGKSLWHLNEMGVKKKLEKSPHFRVTSIVFGAPKGHTVNIPLPEDEVERLESGYSLPRKQFDWLVFERANEIVLASDGAVVQGAKVGAVIWAGIDSNDDPGPGTGDQRRAEGVKVNIDGEQHTYFADLIVGAAGANCPVARALLKETYNGTYTNRLHTCGGWREYWTNVKGCEGNDGAIEIHFLYDVIPGYFWLFPTSGGQVNVGCGMLASELDKRKGKLRAIQHHIIHEHPIFKERFADATMVQGSNRGWQLPFGSPRNGKDLQPRRMFGNGIACIGDSASLIDPFSGEGIGNAFVSSRLMCEAWGTIEKDDDGRKVWDITTGLAYQNAVWKTLGAELSNSHRMQKMLKRTWLVNWMIKKAGRKPKLQEVLTEMIASKEAQEKMHSKWFLLRQLLF